MIEPEMVIGNAGDIVTITCIVGNVEPGSTMLLTDNAQQLAIINQTVLTDRVVYTFGPLDSEDNGRTVICQYGTNQASGNISVLCEFMQYKTFLLPNLTSE